MAALALARGGLVVTVYVAFLGNYTDRGTIGVYLTERLAKQALWDRPEWHAEMAALHWPFLHSGQIGPMRPWYDIECWQVGDEWVPSRALGGRRAGEACTEQETR